MSEFTHGKLSPWGYIIDSQNVPDFITVSEFNQYTGGKFQGDSRIDKNIPSATASIRNFCGWHISPELHCGMIFRAFDLRDAFIGCDLVIQLPATHVTGIVKIFLNASFDADTGDYDGDEVTDYDLDPSGLLRIYDVGCLDRKEKIFIHYTAGYPDADISVIKELTANRVTHSVTDTYGVSSETAGGVSVSYSAAWSGNGSAALSDDTREVLDTYKVKGVF